MAYSLTTVNIISSFLILVLGWFLATIFSNILKKVIKNIGLNKAFEKHLKFTLEHNLSSIVKYALIAVAFVLALRRLGIPARVFYWTLGVIIVLTLIFTLLALKDLIPNFLSWIYITKTQKIKRGDTFSVKGVQGNVLRVNVLETKVRTEKGEIIFIPNTLVRKTLKKQ